MGVEGGYDENDEIESGIYVMILNPSINTTIHVSGISFLYPWRKSNILNILIDNLKYNRFSLTYGWSMVILNCSNLMMVALCL